MEEQGRENWLLTSVSGGRCRSQSMQSYMMHRSRRVEPSCGTIKLFRIVHPISTAIQSQQGVQSASHVLVSPPER